MPKKKVTKAPKTTKAKTKPTKVTVEKTKEPTFFESIQKDLNQKQSLLNLILGALIVIVLGILVFNFFHKPSDNLGPAQQINTDQTAKKPVADKYTVQPGDSLFAIAQKYYNDGYKFPLIAKANNLANEDLIEPGQVINIPKLTPDQLNVQPSIQPSPSASASDSSHINKPSQIAKDKTINKTPWGEVITTDTYIVKPGDWLSKIAGRAYGDPLTFDKIARANNINDPNVIEPGTILRIPHDT